METDEPHSNVNEATGEVEYEGFAADYGGDSEDNEESNNEANDKRENEKETTLPVMTGSEVRELLQEVEDQSSNPVQTLRENAAKTERRLNDWMNTYNVTDGDLSKALDRQNSSVRLGLHFATGDSDSESIKDADMSEAPKSVSYTHLTLPTIYSV